MPRSTKLTSGIQTAITQAVSVGVPYLQAAVLAGIGESTAKQWRQRGDGTHGRPSTPVYVAFVADLKKAEAQDEARRIARIEQAAQGGMVVYEKTVTYPDGRTVTEVKRTAPEWTADAWHLERAHPERWARKDRYDLNFVVQRAAAKVAEEFGLTAEQVLAEAPLLLKEVMP